MKYLCKVVVVLAMLGLATGVQAETSKDAIAKKLEQRVTLQFQEATVSDAVAFLRAKAADLNIVLLMSPEQAKAARVTLSLKDVPMRDALRYIAELVGVGMRIEDHSVVLSPNFLQDSAPAKRYSTRLNVKPAESAGQYFIECTILEGDEVLSTPRMLTTAGKEGVIKIMSQDTRSGVVLTAMVSESNGLPSSVATTTKVMENGVTNWQSSEVITLTGMGKK